MYQLFDKALIALGEARRKITKKDTEQLHGRKTVNIRATSVHQITATFAASSLVDKTVVEIGGNRLTETANENRFLTEIARKLA